MIIWAKQVPAFWSGLQNIHFFILFHPFVLFPYPCPYRGCSCRRFAQYHLSLEVKVSLLTLVCQVQFSLTPWVMEHTTSGQLRHTVLWQRGHWWKIDKASLENMLMQITACSWMLFYLAYAVPASCGRLNPSLQTKEQTEVDLVQNQDFFQQR